MSKTKSKAITSLQQIGDNLNIGKTTVWDTMDKIKFRFERNKHFLYYMEDKEFDLEELF